MQTPKAVKIKLNLHVIQISGEWEPSDAERAAAWELYVELITRVAMVPLGSQEGLLREALTSLYSLFPTTRDILRRHGPAVAMPKPPGQYNLGYLAVVTLNVGLRPFLTRWHPALEDWEAQRPADRSRIEHETMWNRASELRIDLTSTGDLLSVYTDLLGAACGIPDLFRVNL